MDDSWGSNVPTLQSGKEKDVSFFVPDTNSKVQFFPQRQISAQVWDVTCILSPTVSLRQVNWCPRISWGLSLWRDETDTIAKVNDIR